MAIATGLCDVALICHGSTNISDRGGRAGPVSAAGSVFGPSQFEEPYGISTVGSYALAAQRHMHEYGTTSEQLAEIALQSAASAQAFGIEPRVAMISYSTGTSGAGEDVSKVAEATELARQRMPQLLVDGPLQYDAAAISDVGRKKAPDSPENRGAQPFPGGPVGASRRQRSARFARFSNSIHWADPAPER